MAHKKLIYSTTGLSVTIKLLSISYFAFTMECCVPEPYTNLIREFQTLTVSPNWTKPVTHDVVHHIITCSQPAHAVPWRLSPEKLQVARQEFKHILEIEIVQPSSSCWFTQLHMVPKKTAGD